MDTVMKRLEQAKELIIKNNLSDAFNILKELIKIYPDEDSVIFETGKINFILKKYNEAIFYLEQIKTFEYKILTYNLLIYSYRVLNKYIEIFKIYENIKKEKIRISKNDLDIIIDVLKKLNKYEEFNYIAELLEPFDDKIYKLKDFFSSQIDYYNDLLNKNNDFYEKLKIYKEIFTALKTNSKILLKFDFFYEVADKIFNNLINFLEYLNSMGELKYVQCLYKELKPLFDKKNKKIRNILLNEYEISKRSVTLKSLPRVIEFALTNKCNLRCVMCGGFNNSGDFTISDKKVDDLIEIMPYLQELMLRGGEVLLDERLNKILESAKKNNVKVNLITNGTLFTEENINFFIDQKINITLSIDSIIKEKYEKIRIGSDFNKLISNIKLLSEIRKSKQVTNDLGINIVVMPINYMEIENIIEFAGKHNFQKVNLLPPIISNRRQYQYKLTKSIVEILESKRKLFYDLAAKYNMFLLNRLPDKMDDDYFIDEEFPDNDKECFCGINDTKKGNILDKDIINVCEEKEIQTEFNSKLFCYEPFRRITIDNRQALPSCLCPIVVEYNSKQAKRCLFAGLFTK